MQDKILNLLIQAGAVVTALVIAAILYLFLVEMPNQDIRHKAYVECLDTAYNNTSGISSSEYTENHYHRLVSDCMIRRGYLNGKLFAE